MVEICQYYSNSQSVCSLMIDDMVPVAVSDDGSVKANNDWGYLMDEPKSLYSYFHEQIIKKYPDIKGTIFLPLSSQNHIPSEYGYKIYKRQVNSNEFLSFLSRISDQFEMAFHGDKHGYMKDGVPIAECANINTEDVNIIISAVKSFCNQSGIKFEGGKFPAYLYNETALEIIRGNDARWWALDVSMINKACFKNRLLFDENLNIVLIPTNVNGDIFNKFFITPSTGLKNRVKSVLRKIIGRDNKYSNPIKFLNYLYSNKLPIIIQEHFQSIRTDGRRQVPCVYDDIFSLDLIFSFLRGKDIWYATCSELAHYYESFIHSSIRIINESSFILSYSGIYDEPFISLKTSTSKLLHVESDREIQGIFKNNSYWVFNRVKPGTYKILK